MANKNKNCFGLLVCMSVLTLNDWTKLGNKQAISDTNLTASPFQ